MMLHLRDGKKLTPCTRTIIRHPNWYIQVVVEFEQRDFRLESLYSKQFFCGENDPKNWFAHLNLFQLGGQKIAHWNHHFGEKMCLLDTLFFQTCTQRWHNSFENPPNIQGHLFFCAGKFGPPKNHAERNTNSPPKGFSRWWQLKDERNDKRAMKKQLMICYKYIYIGDEILFRRTIS